MDQRDIILVQNLMKGLTLLLVLHYSVCQENFPTINGTVNGTDILLYAGDDVTLVCEFNTTDPTTTLSLNCNGQSGVPDREGNITRNTLTISINKNHHQSNCTCQENTTNTYTFVKFNVYYSPGPDITIKFTPVLPWLEDANNTAECVAAEGNPPASYSWSSRSRRSVINPADQHQTVINADNQRKTHIRVVKESNNDTLVCNLRNNYTEVKSKTLSAERTLIVEYSPRVSTRPSESISANEGDPLNIECWSDSNPAAQPENYRWTVTGDTEDTESTESQDLNITSVDVYKHHGLYTCNVTVSSTANGPLTGHASLNVSVYGRPRKPVNLNARATAISVNLTWWSQFNGRLNQTFTVHYRKGGTEEYTQHQSHISDPGENQTVSSFIRDLNESSTYYFRVTAHNDFKNGTTNKSDVIQNVTKGLPQLPSGELSVDYSDNKAHLTWGEITGDYNYQEMERWPHNTTNNRTLESDCTPSWWCSRYKTRRDQNNLTIEISPGTTYCFMLTFYDLDVRIMRSQCFQRRQHRNPDNLPLIIGLSVGLGLPLIILIILAILFRKRFIPSDAKPMMPRSTTTDSQMSTNNNRMRIGDINMDSFEVVEGDNTARSDQATGNSHAPDNDLYLVMGNNGTPLNKKKQYVNVPVEQTLDGMSRIPHQNQAGDNEYSASPTSGSDRGQIHADYGNIGHQKPEQHPEYMSDQSPEHQAYGNVAPEGIDVEMQNEHNELRNENFYGNINNEAENPDRVSNVYGNVQPKAHDNVTPHEVYANVDVVGGAADQFDGRTSESMPSYIAPSPPAEPEYTLPKKHQEGYSKPIPPRQDTCSNDIRKPTKKKADYVNLQHMR